MRLLVLLLLFTAQFVALSASAESVTINGAGATFPYPLYSKWFSEYGKVKPGAEINYQSIGSGAGIKQFLDGTIDFGASDAPMTDEQIAKAKQGVVHVPTALGAVIVTYNLGGATPALQFSGQTIANIFLGKITKWDDAAIAKDNPGVKLPGLAILVAHRSDGSGTTAVFTDYLSKVSADWKSVVGAGTAVKWPAGLGGKGNEGVTGLIKQTPGALGYVELIYAEKNQLPVAKIKNASGAFVSASVQSVTQAGEGAIKTMPADFRVSITNAPGKAAYPIASYTYLLLPKKMPAAKGKVMIDFLGWALNQGQALTGTLSYSPLPKALLPKVRAKVAEVKAE